MQGCGWLLSAHFVEKHRVGSKLSILPEHFSCEGVFQQNKPKEDMGILPVERRQRFAVSASHSMRLCRQRGQKGTNALQVVHVKFSVRGARIQRQRKAA